MMDFKGLILIVCFVTALGLNTKRQNEKEVDRHVTFSDGFVCTMICENRTDMMGRTAKCFITHEEKVHATLVRNPSHKVWLFYTVDDINVEEDELCDEAVAGDAFLKNNSQAVCSSLQNVKHFTTVDLSKGKNVRSSSDKNDNHDINTLIDKLDRAANKVFQKTSASTTGFAEINKEAKTVAQKVVETMDRLKKEIELLEEEEYDLLTKVMNKKSDEANATKRHDSKDVFRRSENFIDRLVRTLTDIAKRIIDDVEDAFDTRRMNKPYSSEEFSDEFEKGELLTPPPLTKFVGDDSTPPKKGFSYIAPPTFPPYNPDGFKQGYDSEELDDDYPIRPSKQGGYDPSKYQKKGLSHIAPPTFPPYNPPGYSVKNPPKQFNEADWTNPYFPKPKKDPPQKPKNQYDIIQVIKSALKRLMSQFNNLDEESFEILEDLYQEIIELENSRNNNVGQPENVLPFIFSPGLVGGSIVRVKRSAQSSEETDEGFNAQYHPVDFNTMKSLCGLMTTRICEETKVMHCQKDKTCCWAEINPSTCKDSSYDEFANCYSILVNILDTLITR